MKRILISVAFVLLAITCFAQKQKVSVVELQNGSTIRGVLLESVEGTIKIQTADQSVFVYNESDVKAITTTEQQYKIAGVDGRGPIKGHYRGFVDVGFGCYAWGLVGSNPIELETSHGFQFLDWLYCGAGAGMHYVGGKISESRVFRYKQQLLIPVFGEVRVDFINHSLTPFVSMKVGYNIEAIRDIKGSFYESNTYEGLYMNPMVGVRLALGCLGLNFSAGYTIRNKTWHYSNGGITRGLSCHEITIKAGIEF